jgi:hypothetical protein
MMMMIINDIHIYFIKELEKARKDPTINIYEKRTREDSIINIYNNYEFCKFYKDNNKLVVIIIICPISQNFTFLLFCFVFGFG